MPYPLQQMTTPPGQDPRPGARRGGLGRSRREADSGWADSGAGGPRFTPTGAAGGGGRPLRDPDGGFGRRDGGDPRGSRFAPGGGGAGERRDGPDLAPSFSPRGGSQRGAVGGRGTGAGAGAGGSFDDPWASERRDRARDRSGRVPERTRGRVPVPERPRSGPPAFRWVGRVPAGLALLIFLIVAVIGAIGTVTAHRDPGSLLGISIIVGACAAALCIRRRSVYLLIPLPALTYLVLSVLAGYFHDRSLGMSKTALAGDFTQWLAGGFTDMVVATVLVLLIFGARLLVSRQLVSGQFAMSAQRAPDGRVPPSLMSPPSRPDRDPRGNRPPWDDSAWNGRGRPGDSPRGDRDPRDGRQAWYEQPRPGGRGGPADNDQQRTQALPAFGQQPPGRGPNRDVPRGRTPRRPNDDRWG